MVLGDTTTAVPVKAPGFHEYVCAPAAVMVAEFDTQIEGDEGVRFRLGVGLTTTATVCVDKQPNAEDAATVYTLVTAGVTVMLALTKLPGFHT